MRREDKQTTNHKQPPNEAHQSPPIASARCTRPHATSGDNLLLRWARPGGLTLAIIGSWWRRHCFLSDGRLRSRGSDPGAWCVCVRSEGKRGLGGGAGTLRVGWHCRSKTPIRAAGLFGRLLTINCYSAYRGCRGPACDYALAIRYATTIIDYLRCRLLLRLLSIAVCYCGRYRSSYHLLRIVMYLLAVSAFALHYFYLD